MSELSYTLDLPDGATASFGCPENAWRLSSLRLGDFEYLAAGNAMADAAQEQLPTNTGWEFFADGVAWAAVSEKLTPCPPVVKDGGVVVLRSECADVMAVELHARASTKVGALELKLVIENLGDAPTKLHNIEIGVISLARSFCSGADVIDGDTGQRVPFFYTDPGGYPASLAVHRPEDEFGLAMLPLIPGRTKRLAMNLGNHLITGYRRAEPTVEWHLEPGEKFVSEGFWLVPYQGDTRSAIRGCVATEIRPEPVPQPITYCSWMPFMEDIDEPRLLGQIEEAADLGFEVFLIDGGWETGRRFGERTFDPERFPGGISKLREATESKGMRLGLWTTLNSLHRDGEDAQTHPEWAARYENGEPVATNAGHAVQRAYCVLSGQGERWLQQMRDLIREGNLRYIKVDFPMIYDLYMPAPVVCHSEGHEHRIPGEYALRAYRKSIEMARQLKDEFPDVIIDYTYELWAHWLTMDLALVAGADVCWMSNQEDDPGGGFDGPRAVRELAQLRSQTIPAAQQVCGNVRADGPDGLRSFLAVVVSYPMLLGDLRVISETKREELKKFFKAYRELRKLAGDLPVDAFATTAEGALPCPRQAWAGVIRASRDGRGWLIIFRDDSELEEANLAFIDILWNVPVAQSLSFKPLYGTDENFIATPKDLSSGRRYKLPEKRSYAVYEFQPQ